MTKTLIATLLIFGSFISFSQGKDTAQRFFTISYFYSTASGNGVGNIHMRKAKIPKWSYLESYIKKYYSPVNDSIINAVPISVFEFKNEQDFYDFTED